MSVVIESAEIFGNPANDPTCPLRWQRYHPSTGTQWPIVLFFYDGGFENHGWGPPQTPHNLEDAANEVAGHGWQGIPCDVRSDNPLNYIVGQTTTGFSPQQQDDAFTALLAARAHASWDGSKVFVVGGSGGANLGLECCGNATLGANRADGGVCMSGPYDFSDRTPYKYLAQFSNTVRTYCNVPDDSAPNLAIQLAASPVSRINSSISPVMIVRAPNEFMPPVQATKMIAKLDALGVTNYSSVLEGTNQHSWEHWPLIHASALAFFDALLGGTPPPPTSTTAHIIVHRQ